MKKWATSVTILLLAVTAGGDLHSLPIKPVDKNASEQSHLNQQTSRKSSSLARAEGVVYDDEFFDEDQDLRSLRKSRREERRRRKARLYWERNDPNKPEFWIRKARKNTVGAWVYGGVAGLAFVVGGAFYLEANRYSATAAMHDRRAELFAFDYLLTSNGSTGQFFFYYLPWLSETSNASYARSEALYYRNMAMSMLGAAVILVIPTAITLVRANLFGKRAEKMMNKGNKKLSTVQPDGISLCFQPRLREKGGDLSLTLLFL